MFAKLHLSKSLHDSFFITAQQSSASTSKFGVPVFCRHSQMLKATSLYFKKRNCPCRKRTIRKHNPPAQIPRSVSGNGHQFPPPRHPVWVTALPAHAKSAVPSAISPTKSNCSKVPRHTAAYFTAILSKPNSVYLLTATIYSAGNSFDFVN